MLMANVQIKNVPADVHAELKRRAALEHMTVRDYVLRLIERDQMRMSGQEWLERLHSDESVDIGIDPGEAIREMREERDAHLERVSAEARARYEAQRRGA